MHHATGKQQEPDGVDQQRHGPGQRQHAQTDQGGGYILRRIAERPDRLVQGRHTAVADLDVVLAPLTRHQHRQNQQENEVQAGPQGGGVC